MNFAAWIVIVSPELCANLLCLAGSGLRSPFILVSGGRDYQGIYTGPGASEGAA